MNAKYESAEPAVRAAALGADQGKVPSPDEVAMKKSAEARVRTELEGSTTKDSKVARVEVVAWRGSRPTPSVSMDQSQLDMIDILLDKTQTSSAMRGGEIFTSSSSGGSNRSTQGPSLFGRDAIKRPHMEARTRRDAVLASRDPDAAAAVVVVPQASAVPDTIKVPGVQGDAKKFQDLTASQWGWRLSL